LNRIFLGDSTNRFMWMGPFRIRVPEQTIFTNRSNADQNGPSNRSTSKLLLTFIFIIETWKDFPKKLNFSKDGYYLTV
jgi:hypothetical protein